LTVTYNDENRSLEHEPKELGNAPGFTYFYHSTGDNNNNSMKSLKSKII
jgi:hypothetical protein